jgi:ferredoxin
VAKEEGLGNTRISGSWAEYYLVKCKKNERRINKMPWVDKDECVGCGECVAQCPVNTIFMIEEKAEVNMNNCIRCGVCHDVCPEDAVKHDSEKIPDEVNANVEKTRRFMDACAKHLGDVNEKQKCLNRMIKHFTKERVIAEKTLEKLQMLKRE